MGIILDHPSANPRPAFTLVELLVVIAIIAVLVGILLPTLAGAREASRAAVCLSNHRQMALICAAYADEHRGHGPALGQPYTSVPNWSLVVQQASGRGGTTADELYSPGSVLVCPTIRGAYGRDMTRTYAANATGLAGASGDRANFDTPPPGPLAHVRFDRITRPASTPMIFDGAIASITGTGPPSTRTASVLDLRSDDHQRTRLGRFHGGIAGEKGFQVAMFDGSVSAGKAVLAEWLVPLP